MKLLGNLKKGLLFVLSAPAGTGKTTLVSMLEDEFEAVKRAITYTTRPKREKEEEEQCYHFISEEQFAEKLKRNEFIENAKVFDYSYGIGKQTIEKQLDKSHVILVIDTQGLKSLVEQNISLISIFISPPSMEELELRLTKRKTESKKSLEKRLSRAKKEIEMIPWYDYHIINEDLVLAYTVLRSILIAEEHKAKRVGEYVFRKPND